MTSLARLCASHGIEPDYVDFAGETRPVSEKTLRAFAELFGLETERRDPPAGIPEALKEKGAPRCFVPDALRDARVWGLTCQLPSLRSARTLGTGDFADLETLVGIAAAEGADFVGLNPVHAMFWSDCGRISPFSPSNRLLLNPLYVAPDWIEGFEGLAPAEAAAADALRDTPLLDYPAAAALRAGILRRLFERGAWNADAFAVYRAERGETLESHALFEALSAAMTADGHGAGWQGWPEPFRDRHAPEVAAFAREHAGEVRFHAWLQWQADRQLARVQSTARRLGMRIGLYLDLAVGAAPDGSATWAEPGIIMPALSIGAPPDAFFRGGQDWGLAPISPVATAERDGGPVADVMEAVMRHAGAVRIDHAMSLHRLWLIPHGMGALEGAYLRYPLSTLLARLSETSAAARCLVIGEDLGVVPEGFRPLMHRRRLHSYLIWMFERGDDVLPDPESWPVEGLACLGTHDLPTVRGWLEGADIELAHSLGHATAKEAKRDRAGRAKDVTRIATALGAAPAGAAALSPALHRHMAASPARLAALQIEDALGLVRQVNLPGTVDEHPNWRHPLPVALEALATDRSFSLHTAAMREARPR